MILTYEDMHKIQNYWQSPNTIAREHKREEDKELRDKQYRNSYLRNRIQRVKFDNPWTIVWWKDGSITRVKCSNLDTFTEESGLMAAICKHYYEDTNIFGEMLHKWCKPTPQGSLADLDAAYDAGYNDGYTAGYDDGDCDGRLAEHDEAHDEGWALGYNSGYEQGYSDGKTL